jgi:hypothetical protein
MDKSMMAQMLMGQGAPKHPMAPGMTQAGTLDLSNRPMVPNSDGSISTVRSMGANMDGREVLMPTVHPDGYVMDNRAAIAHYLQTGQHLGMFDTPQNLEAYSKQLSEEQARQYLGPKR